MKKTARRKKNSSKNTIIFGIIGICSFGILALGFLIKLFFYDLGFAFSPTSYDLTKEDYAVISEIEVNTKETSKLVQIEAISFVIYDKAGKRITKYTIPTTLTVDIAGKFGEESLSKVLALNLLGGGDLKSAANSANKTLEKILGFHIDRFVVIDTHEDQSGSVDGLLFQGKTMELPNLKQIMLSVTTNMSIKEFYDLITFSSSLPQDRISQELVNVYDFSEISAYFNEKLRDLTFDSKVAYDKNNISVLNGTEFSGIATFGSRGIQNLGGHVVSTDNASKTYDTSCIITDEKDTETVKQLSKFLGIKKIISKEEAGQLNEAVVNRSDIVVILGFDFAQSIL